MKTFKQHIKEGQYMGGQVGVSTSNAVEDGSIGVHNINEPEVLKRVKEGDKEMSKEKEKALNIATS